MNKINNTPSSNLRIHLHIDNNLAEFCYSQVSYDQKFLYTLKCIREACVLAKRLQCTVWFEDVFLTYCAKISEGYNLYINPNDEYDDFMEWYRNAFSDEIIKYVSKDVIEDIDLRTFFAGILGA
jgi:hypothetical protein